jgi:cellulose synthase/poly-beta-1,6-N-acetylglucosamine synthase-like glycosyltransferase
MPYFREYSLICGFEVEMNSFVNIILWIAYVSSLYFSIFLLLVFFDKRQIFEKESDVHLEKFPMVSIIVPAFNEEKTIKKTLISIHNIDYPKDKYEVIVINDGSSDRTPEIVLDYIKDKNNFQLISHDNMGKGASMNKAIGIAKGEFFTCLDADSFVHKLTLRKMLNMYYKENDPRLAIITPAMKVDKPNNLMQKVQWIEYIVIILIARLSSHLDSIYVAPGPFSLYVTQIIRDVGGFDEVSITEDQEIAYRMQLHHYKIRQCFDGYVYTNAPRKIIPFYRQRRRWYLGSIDCVRKYKNLIANKNYGDFGLIQMVKNVAGYVLATTGILIAIYLVIIPLFKRLKNLFLVNFDIWTYIMGYKFKFDYFDILVADIKIGILVLVLFMLGFYFFYMAHKNANEKMMKVGLIVLIPYFAFYYLLKGIILLLSFIEYAQGKKIKWR